MMPILEPLYPALEQSKMSSISDVRVSLNPTVSVFMPGVVWRLPKWKGKCDVCGNVHGVVACDNHKEDRRFIVDRCFRPDCSFGYKAWAGREANRVVERLSNAKRLYKRVGYNLYRERHIVFSPPQDWAVKLMVTEEGYKELRDVALDVMCWAGVSGGVVVFHSHRQNKVFEGVYSRPDLLPGEWYVSPHFHIVGFGYLLDADYFNYMTGWVYKNKGFRKTLFGTIHYLHTHAGLGYVGDDRVFHCATWFGIVSYNRLSVDKVVKKTVFEKCLVCGRDKMLYDVCYCHDQKGFSDVDRWVEMGYYTKVVLIRHFKLRLPKNKSVLQERLGADYG